MENLGEITAPEIKYQEIKRLSQNERLACQAIVTGDLTVKVPDIYKLPHLEYSE